MQHVCQPNIAKIFDVNSTVVKESYRLHTYERNIQVSNMRTIDAQILIDILTRTIPEGVELSVHEHSEEENEVRWVPDPLRNAIKDDLFEMAQARRAEREGSDLKTAAKQARKEKAKLDELYAEFQSDDAEEEE